MVERALEPGDERPDSGMELAQHGPDFLRLARLGERGVAAQVTKHDDDVAAVAFENAFVAGRDDHLGELRGEKALQASDSFDLAELRCDALLERAVPHR